MNYEADLALYAEEQVSLLRTGRVLTVNLQHVAEEIEGYSRVLLLAEEETGMDSLPVQSS